MGGQTNECVLSADRLWRINYYGTQLLAEGQAHDLAVAGRCHNLIFALHYVLLHALSGAVCSFFQIIVLLLFLLQERFRWNKIATAMPITAVFLLIAVVTYETPVTLLPILASLVALLPFFQSNKWMIQGAGIVSGLSWLMYVIAVRSYSGMVTESVLTGITAASLMKKEPKGGAEQEDTQIKGR